MKPKIIDRDYGYKRIARLPKEPTMIDVGIMGPQASADRGGQTMVEIASFHEFGEGVPKRSFLADWLTERHGKHMETVRKIALKRVDGAIGGKQALELLGLYAVGSVQSRISEGIAPANSAVTIARKGSSTPLIDTGQLRTSVSYRQSKD